MKYIPLTKGFKAQVSDEDFERVSKVRWRVLITKYGKYAQSGSGILMHRFILDDPIKEIDHIDRDGLNNQRANLRCCTSSQNKQNTKLRADNSTGYRGVYYNKRDKKYYAQIKPEGRKRLFLGSFDTALAASLKYDSVAASLFGEFK